MSQSFTHSDLEAGPFEHLLAVLARRELPQVANKVVFQVSVSLFLETCELCLNRCTTPEECVMVTTIAPVANIQLPTTSRVMPTAWCPDKDLLVVTSHVSHQEKMTLYNMQGSKKWEVTIQPQLVGKIEADVVGITWSPDGTISSAS